MGHRHQRPMYRQETKFLFDMKIEFYGHLVDGKFRFYRRPVWDAFLAGQKDGDYYVTITKRKGPPKTLEQLSYYYAVIIPTVYNQMVEDGHERFVVKVGAKFKEIPLTTDVVDLVLKESCAFDEKSKAKMSKEECSAFIDRCIRWAARWLSCVIPPPEGE